MGQLKHFSLVLILALSASTLKAEITIHCQGSGQAVYLIGGGPAFTTWNLEPIQQLLRNQFKVCRWDMRGVGDNAQLEIRPDTPVLQQWLEDMTEVLPQQPVVLWGHSWGALQSLLFTRQYPERVKALVLNNPVDPQLNSLENIELKRYVHPYVESQLKIEDIDTPNELRHRFRSKIASYFINAKQGWDYSAGFDASDTNNTLNVQIWQEYRQSPLAKADIKLLSAKIIRLIYCKQDVLMPENLEQYKKDIPQAKHYVINNCAHFPWVETPVEYSDILVRTLTE